MAKVDRWAFLAGEGSLTVAEVVEWAKELGAEPSIPGDMDPMSNLMVAAIDFADQGAMWRVGQ